MRRLDTMSTSNPGGTDTLKLDNFPERFSCAGLLLRFTYPVDNSGPSVTPPSIDELMKAAVGSLTIRWGESGQHVIYSTVPGDELRNVHRFVHRVEVPNDILTSWVSVGPAQFTISFDLYIPFAVEGLRDGRDYVPGWSQMRTMIIDLVEGPDLGQVMGSPDITRAVGLMSVDVDPITYPCQLDRGGPILSYFRANQAALKNEGPDGMLLGAWEASAPQASTAVELYSLDVSGLKVAETVPPYVAADKYLASWDTGVSPITDDVTLAYSPDEGQSTADLPSGQLSYIQAQQYVPTIQFRGLYWPPMGIDLAKEICKTAAQEAGGSIVASLPEYPSKYPGNVIRCGHLTVHTPDTPGFTLGVGLLVPTKGADPILSIPESKTVTAEAQVNIAATAGSSTMLAAQSKVLETLSRQIPGLAAVVSGRKQKTDDINPQAYLDALSTVAGTKGEPALAKLKAAVKLS